MSAFRAGDLCIVVDHPEWSASGDWRMKQVRGLIGKICILVEGPIELPFTKHDRQWSPFWKISGLKMPEWFVHNTISEKVLRKIEPPPEVVTENDIEELTA